MLRVHLLQHWYSLSDPAMEEALIEVPTMRRFAGIVGNEPIEAPDMVSEADEGQKQLC